MATTHRLATIQHSFQTQLGKIVLAIHWKVLLSLTLFLLLVISTLLYVYQSYSIEKVKQQKTLSQLKQVQKELIVLKNVDQYKRNESLQATISAIEKTYQHATKVYEDLLDLRTQTDKTQDMDTLFAESLSLLSQKNYASAEADLVQLTSQISQTQQKLAAASAPTVNATSAPSSNTPPSSGYNRQSITADTGTFVADIIAADLNSTRVIVDTASDSDCGNNCPAYPLATYASRNGAYAAINGTFFCPPEYPSCVGKTNSFDTLLMNKNKVYFNSANNVYSTVPLVYFTGNTMGVRAHSSDWGRDTGVDSVIAMQPLLILNKQIVYGDSSDTKFTNKGTRNFIANKGNTVYIGTIYNANMTDSAHVLQALGMENALNLDEGGSTALWLNGSYINGPGRNIPNAVLFVRK